MADRKRGRYNGVVMQRAVHIVSTLAVLLHILGGCCLHHAHGADPHREANSPGCTARHGCCGCRGNEPAGTPDDTSSHGRHCEMNCCTFVVPGSSSAGPVAAPECAVGLAALPTLAGQLPKVLLAVAVEACHPPGSRLRLHLLKRVLLI